MSPAWAERLRFAVRGLGLRPDDFWALTLAEWRALTAPEPWSAPLSRGDLDDLLAAHPDLTRSGDRHDR
ncbi:MAG: phage tail assembly chaperone [Alphaproteobacteria bacterium]|nr:phage tail assembly chaperone [Alphaproteobacteria bacterium]